MSNFFTRLKQLFSGPPSHLSKKNCSHCGGRRCIGACGSTFANLSPIEVQGTVQLKSQAQGLIQAHDGVVFTFETEQKWGRIILKKCPPGSQCQIRALFKNNHLETLISVKKA